jgi:hypothetical protein
MMILGLDLINSSGQRSKILSHCLIGQWGWIGRLAVFKNPSWENFCHDVLLAFEF